MSLSKYFKNFILCGDVDYHCLLCNENFANTVDLEKHIRWEKHRKSLKTQTCLPQYKKDNIYKIKNYFYCENCNYTTKDKTQIKVHSESENHGKYRDKPETFPKRVEALYADDSVIINQFLINKHQWHGIINKKCVFCDVVVQNIMEHTRSQQHMIMLIQAEVICFDDKLYRKINNKIFQCFKCKKIVPSETFEEHFKDHDSEPNKTTDEAHKVNGDNKIIYNHYDTAITKEIHSKIYDLRQLNVVEDDFFNIDVKNNKVTCKICKKPVILSLSKLCNHKLDHDLLQKQKMKSNLIEAINNEIEKKYVYVHPDNGKIKSQLAKYGKENYIKLNSGANKGYCTLCDKFLPGHIDVFKTHIGGSSHRGHLELKGFIKPQKHVKKSYPTGNLGQFLRHIVYSDSMEAFWINIDFVIDFHSFFLLKQIEHGIHYKKTRCFTCDETFEWKDEKEHCMTRKHKSNFMAARVVFFERELIREVQPRLFHCGYCNTVIPFMEMVETHMESLSHKMQIVQKHFAKSISEFVEQYGFRPNSTNITRNVDNEELYLQLLNVVFGK